MKALISILASIYLASGCVAYCQSILINFDDIPAAGLSGSTPIADGYAGFDWNNFCVLDSSGNFPPGGYVNGALSSPNVAYNAAANPASISAINSFVLLSGYFTAAFNNGLSLEVTGMNGATTEYDNSYTLNAGGPILINFPNISLTEVEFASSGGAPAGYQGAGAIFVLDNLTIEATPEPSTWALVIGGAGWLAVLRKRCRAGSFSPQ